MSEGRVRARVCVCVCGVVCVYCGTIKEQNGTCINGGKWVRRNVRTERARVIEKW